MATATKKARTSRRATRGALVASEPVTMRFSHGHLALHPHVPDLPAATRAVGPDGRGAEVAATSSTLHVAHTVTGLPGVAICPTAWGRDTGSSELRGPRRASAQPISGSARASSSSLRILAPLSRPQGAGPQKALQTGRPTPRRPPKGAFVVPEATGFRAVSNILPALVAPHTRTWAAARGRIPDGADLPRPRLESRYPRTVREDRFPFARPGRHRDSNRRQSLIADRAELKGRPQRNREREVGADVNDLL
jgi:hypothetical protein